MSSGDALARSPLSERTFVRWFVGAVSLFALSVAAIVAARPSLWPYVVTADLWLLSFPHVASTFSRTAFRAADRREHWWLLVALPLLSIGGVAAIAGIAGIAALNGGYLLWQTFHYVRQGRGMYRALRHANGAEATDPLADWTMYLVALWAVTHRVAQRPTTFLSVPIALPVIPTQVEIVCAISAALALFAYALRSARDALSRRGRLEPASTLYLLTQVVIFVAAYIVIDSPSIGWLAVNLWHNAQYLFFVYAWNNRRYAHRYNNPDNDNPNNDNPDNDKPDALRWFVAPERWWLFYTGFAAIGAAMYTAAALLADASVALFGLGATYLVLVHAINAHHYIADMVLWRAPRRPSSPSR
jgi:hypothetical protein